MSRCFPFPPPGYDKKARVEDIDLLKKEKSIEKKVKKEKKDKEKRESKEKRHKDRSDEEKRKEKKEKKERDGEKKKKDRDKNKTSTSDEQRLLGKTDDHNGGNLLHKEHQANDVNSSLKKPDAGQSAGYTGAKLIQNDHPAKEAKRSELLLDSGKSIKDKEMEKSSAAQSKTEDRMVRLVATASSTSVEVLDSVKSRKIDDRKIGGLGIGKESTYSTTAMAQKPAATVGNSTGAEAVSKPPLEKKDSKPLEKKVDGRKEAKDKIKEGEGSEKRKEKHKDKDREKKVKSKDKEREKERKKEEKAKEKVEEKRGEMKESKESNREKITGSHSTTASQLPENGNTSANLEGSFRKRKDIETNGFLHTDDMRPIKFQKLSSSTHPISGNGKMLEPCQTALDRQGTSSSLTLDSRERKINGVIEAQPSASSDSVKATAIRQVDQKAPPPPKPPHPDCKYLSQIYAVPKEEELCDFGDQEWLCNSSDSRVRKPKSSEVPQVWADAFPIESADIYALPYVIPY